MPPKSAASLCASELHKAKVTRSVAFEKLQERFPELTKARRSQILHQYWGSAAEEKNEETEAASTPVKSMASDIQSGDISTPGAKTTTFASNLFAAQCHCR